jgi:3-hydroxyisobutyrate dehydrogenase
MAAKPTIAVLGAGGTMGLAMARNLARDGCPIVAWNRSAERAAPLADDGAELAGSPAEAAAGADIILTILADADAVDAVMKDVLTADLAPDVLWLQMSTIGEAGTERCLALADEHGLAFVDAPVLGTKEPAEQGQLVVLASGDDALRERVTPIFDVVGRRTIWVGEAGSGTRLKLATNSWILAVVEGTAETLALAEGMGLDPQLVLDAVADGPLDLPYMRLKGKAMMAREFPPSFRLALAAKDAGLVEESIARRRLDLPLVAAVRRRFDAATDEHGEADMSAIFLESIRALRGS